MRLVNVQTMKEMEKAADAAGYSYAEMMQSAGEGIAKVLVKLFSDSAQNTILGLVGKGNNGGDTLITLTELRRVGWNTSVLLVEPRTPGDALVSSYTAIGGNVVTITDLAAISHAASSGGIVLDGIYGTGFHPPMTEAIIDVLDKVRKATFGFTWVAVDCPSGIDAATGEVSPGTIPAKLTICLEAVKTGLMSYAAFPYCGRIVTVDLDIAKFSPQLTEQADEVIDAEIVRNMLPKRPEISHKGTFGKVMVIGGCVNYPGAPVLAGKGAYAVGTGLVQAAITGSIFGCSSASLEMTWLILEDAGGIISENAVQTVFAHLENLNAIVLGPGIGREVTTGRFVRNLILGITGEQMAKAGFPGLDKELTSPRAEQKLPPLVIDADGLFHLSSFKDWHKKIKAGLVLTPHPGEMAILTGLSVEEIQKDRAEVARKFACEWRQTVVLKGALTVVADTAGRVAMIPVTCSGLAKAGSGDVLAGMIGGLLAQGLDPWQAAVTGAWLHAEAGVAATEAIGCAEAVLAGDVINAVPQVYRQLKADNLP